MTTYRKRPFSISATGVTSALSDPYTTIFFDLSIPLSPTNFSRPKGAIWGFAGSDASSMQDYYDSDGTFRNPLEIVSLWNGLGINQGEPVAFYCGTGWRATIPWEMTQMLGWDKAVLFDGGWNEWQMDPSLPIQEGAPNGMKQPDSKNDFN